MCANMQMCNKKIVVSFHNSLLSFTSQLYGDCMTQYLPMSVRWATLEEFLAVKTKFETDAYLQFTGQEDEGYFVLCNLEYPDEIKKLLTK